jgi:hypothetical protein
MDWSITTYLAIYGAVISTILLVYKIFESYGQTRKLSVKLGFSKWSTGNTINFSGRRGNVYLTVTIENKSRSVNNIQNVYLEALNHKYDRKTVSPIYLNFKPKELGELPVQIGYTQTLTFKYVLNVGYEEFQQSYDSNIELIEDLLPTKSKIRACVTDTSGKRFCSGLMNINGLIKRFEEEDIEMRSDHYHRERQFKRFDNKV